MKTGIKIGAGLVAGGVAGLWAFRALRRRNDFGPEVALGDGLEHGTADVPLALLQATGHDFCPDNAVDLLNDASVFDAVEEEIRSARHSVHIDMYIWKPGDPGSRLAELLARRAKQGVKVRVLVDPIGSKDFDTALCPGLKDAGCEIHYFRPPKKRPLSVTGRNHRKIIIVDGRVGFTGGFGVAAEWADPEAWRDVNVRVEGPAVRQLQLAFAAHWLESGGHILDAEEFERARPNGTARACFVTSQDVIGLSSARWVTHIALSAAKRRAWIANAYFVPPPHIVGALCEVSSRGVQVQLLLPGPHQDHPTVTFIQRRLYPRLARCGVEILEYQPAMMHAKTMLIDDDLVVIGSINLDFLSQEFLDEGALVVLDRAFAARFEASFEADKRRSLCVAAACEPRQLASGR